jgi:hypothetical protein
MLAFQALMASRLVKAEKAVQVVAKTPGPVGPAGINGDMGIQGERGEQGLQGERGETGAQGIQGEPGEKGRQGPRGPEGEPGPRGETGPHGQPGIQGEKGDPGEKGEPGEKGDTGPAPAHEWQGTALRFKKPDGKWGKAVDLKGEKGSNGGIIVRGGGSSSGGGMADLIPGNPNLAPTGIAIVQAGQWVNLPWEAFLQTIAGAIDMGAELSRRSDFVGETIIYRGEAAPGAAESAAVWRIKRIEFGTDGDVTEQWASGNANFDKVWADRTGLAYS